MENFRMRVLRNLDLAVDIIHDEGNIILKKYDDLKFYLKKIAHGKIYTYKANHQLNQLKKQYPDLLKGKDRNMKPTQAHIRKRQNKTSLGGSSSSSDNASYMDEGNEDDDLVLFARNLLDNAAKRDLSTSNLTGQPGNPA